MSSLVTLIWFPQSFNAYFTANFLEYTERIETLQNLRSHGGDIG